MKMYFPLKMVDIPAIAMLVYWRVIEDDLRLQMWPCCGAIMEDLPSRGQVARLFASFFWLKNPMVANIQFWNLPKGYVLAIVG